MWLPMTARESQSWCGEVTCLGGQYPSCLWHREQMPRKEGRWESLMNYSDTSLFWFRVCNRPNFPFQGWEPSVGFPHAAASKIQGAGWRETHTHTPLLMREHVPMKPVCMTKHYSQNTGSFNIWEQKIKVLNFTFLLIYNTISHSKSISTLDIIKKKTHYSWK